LRIRAKTAFRKTPTVLKKWASCQHSLVDTAR